MKTKETILCIVIDEKAIYVAEVEQTDNPGNIRKQGRYDLSGRTWANLADYADGFKSFFKENGFNSRKAVVGLPVNIVFSTLIQLPFIADEQLRHDTVGINLESRTELNIADVIFAYDEKQSADGGTLVLALKKQIVSDIKTLLAASKITAVRILNSSMIFDSFKESGLCCNIVELENSLELLLYENSGLVAVNAVSKKPDDNFDEQTAEKIARYINRVRMSLPSGSEKVSYKLISPAERTSSQKTQIENILSDVRFDNPDYKNDFYGYLCSELGRKSSAGKLPAINYLNGRTEQSSPSIVKQHLRKIVYAGILVLVSILAFVFNWQWDKSRISGLKEQLDSIDESAGKAAQMVSQVGYLRQWFDGQVKYLEILRRLSNSFPESSDIWLTSFALDESYNQILTGRTESEDAVLDLAETLRNDGNFEDIKILYLRKMGKGADTMTFAIKLKCRQE